MLKELIEYLLTPCPPEARRLGLLKEAVAIRARHGRCREAWRPHLENCRAAIIRAATSCPGRDTALVLGSGALLDVPLVELSRLFKEVVLADVVHPLPARLRALRLRNVRMVTVDVSGVLAGVLEARAEGPPPRPAPPGILAGLRPDLTVSANVLSQLALAPAGALCARGFSPGLVREFSRAVVQAHIDWLHSLPGTSLLITDTAWKTGGEVLDPLLGATLPAPAEAWPWNIAPRPEAYPDRDVVHEVGAFLLSGRKRT